MKLPDFLRHPLNHANLTNILTDQHHLEPQNIEVSNTTQSIEPLPGGPGQWDIPVPFDTNVLTFSFRSNHTVGLGGAKGGVTGIANRSSLDAATVSHAGSIAVTSYNAIYAKKAAAQNLSHKIFSAAGDHISLSDAYLTLTGPSTRVFRTVWTNYGASYYTLNVWGEVHIIG